MYEQLVDENEGVVPEPLPSMLECELDDDSEDRDPPPPPPPMRLEPASDPNLSCACAEASFSAALLLCASRPEIENSPQNEQ